MRNRIIALLAGLLAACAAIESPTVRPFADHREWVLVEPLEYVIGQSSVSITVPHGFVTDFASIPQPFWSLLSPHGLYSKAAIVHVIRDGDSTCLFRDLREIRIELRELRARRSIDKLPV
jgi:hypothetical protein